MNSTLVGRMTGNWLSGTGTTCREGEGDREREGSVRGYQLKSHTIHNDQCNSHPTLVTVEDGYRCPPVALSRDQPIMQLVLGHVTT